ncbi:MAG TPA: 2-phospho-L-lactate transferase [Terriglobales bacterium]|nr:2-phospho-L-lactate transferase [Terriglobales bacterium]
MIAVLSGGSGGAKFVDGLRQVVPPEELTVIVNTGDDFEWWGLHVSPDLDSITYLLAGLLSRERGWGVQSDTFFCLQAMGRMGQPGWFQIGDRDLAMHLARTQMLKQGKMLTQATAEITASLGIASRVLPMTDARVATMVTTPRGEISFQEYFVQRQFRDEVRAVRFAGAEAATPAPGVLEAIASAEAVLIAPSNPVTSIGPILAVPGVREALRHTAAPVAAVSPIVGRAAVSGPAGALMAAQGLEVSLAGIARIYDDFLDVLVADESDSAEAAELRQGGLPVQCAGTLMKAAEDRVGLALAAVLSAASISSAA